MNILAACFFALAGTWLVFALLYSCFVLVFLRLRSLGRLDDPYSDEFGRIYIFSTPLYIPCGCLFRRYLSQLRAEQPPLRYMTTEERRTAMEELLGQHKRHKSDKSCCELPDSNEDSHDNDDEAPMCSICLGDYEESDQPYSVPTCSHDFHKACLLDWLQRPNNNGCPCCRVEIINEDTLYEFIRSRRRELRKQKRKLARQTPRWSGEGIDTTESTSTTDLELSFPTDASSDHNDRNDLVTLAREQASQQVW